LKPAFFRPGTCDTDVEIRDPDRRSGIDCQFDNGRGALLLNDATRYLRVVITEWSQCRLCVGDSLINDLVMIALPQPNLRPELHGIDMAQYVGLQRVVDA